MAIQRRTIVYEGPGGPFEGVFAWDDELAGTRPGVLVVPNVLGQKEEDNEKAEALAALGYAALACDVFGQGKRAEAGPDYAKYMNEMNADRALLRDRLQASLDALTAQAEVDADQVAAIGFCFGGKCVLDMARSGLAIAGGVSFHGVYDRPDYETKAPIAAKLLVCHGWDDPLGPPDALVALGQELSEAKADWQIHAYGNAGHAFTDTSRKNSTIPGVSYEERADRRSWAAMRDFLDEVFA
jgi:dienelactone hydrolase